MVVAVFALFVMALPVEAKKLASGSGSGPFATAAASGTINKAKKLAVVISASPPGSLTVFTTVACINKRFQTKSSGGNFTMAGPGRKSLPLPIKKNSNCNATVSAGYADVNQAVAGGSITVTLLGKSR